MKIALLGLVTVVAGMAIYILQASAVQIPNITKPEPTVAPTPDPIPTTYVIPIRHHTFQTFNNCGPAALSMALSYYDINVSQHELGNQLRPFQNPQGDNDDKSVTLEELANKATEYDLVAYHRPNGNIELMKQFIANDIPVVTRTWLEPNEDIGHYRVVRGYEDNILIQDDSLQGKNLRYTETEFNTIWNKFNYEYLVLVPQDKVAIAERIIGEDVDKNTAWENAVELSQKQLASNPNDIYARFNLSVALYHTGDFQGSVTEFEKVESSLPFRTLWYQIEPIEAYYELKNYDRVFQITDNILNNHNRAFSELYVIRGNIYKAQGNTELARSEYQKAIQYNVNLTIN